MLGGVEHAKDLHRDARSFAWLDDAWQDLRHAGRRLRQSPGFTVVAVTMLALGIGLNAAVFTVINATLFKGFPLVSRNDRLLYMTSGRGCCVSYSDFLDWRAQATSFQGMAIVHGVQRVLNNQSGFPEQYEATEVSADTFRVAGQAPMIGRDFTAADETPGAPPVAMLSYGFWDRRFTKDPQIVGQRISVGGTATTVVGVMPRGFSFPQKVDLWVPLVPTADVLRRDNRDTWFVFGRLNDGVTVEAARAEMATIGRRLEAEYPADKGFPPVVVRFHEFFIGTNATLIYQAMWGAVAFVLLIACANLANLLLARAIGRARETSVRIALGAGRWRIVRQFLIESLMLSAAGGFAGWWIAVWSVRAYTAYATGAGLSPDIRGGWFDNVLDYSLDYRVFLYLVAISIGTGLLFGLAPARRLSRLDVNAALKDGGRGTGGGTARHLSAALVTAEMALAVVLLAGAGVMVRSFWKIYTADVGFSTQNVVVAMIDLIGGRYPDGDAQIRFFDGLVARAATIPGVESVAIGALPTGGAARTPYEIEGAPPAGDDRRPVLWVSTIGVGYLDALGVRLLAGRDFNDADRRPAVPVVIVNQRFAERQWPGQSPLGKRLRLYQGRTTEPFVTIVGVTSNIAQNDVTQPDADALVYLPYRQAPRSNSWLVVRTRAPLSSVSADIRREVLAMDPTMPIPLGPFSLSDRVADRYRYRAITGTLFVACAAFALLLAAVGLYAVVAHSTSRRTQEIGVRMAIGATSRDILTMVVRQGLLPSAAGLGIGLAASYAVNRALEAQLVQVSPADPVALVTASAVLALSAVLGCLLPALRAMRVDPVVALRHE